MLALVSSPRLLPTTPARNSFGLELTAGSQAALTNTILVSHTVGVYADGDGTVTLQSTLWWTNESDFGGAGSISAGADNTWGVRTDIDGQTRSYGAALDLGADEYVLLRFLYLPIVLR